MAKKHGRQVPLTNGNNFMINFVAGRNAKGRREKITARTTGSDYDLRSRKKRSHADTVAKRLHLSRRFGWKRWKNLGNEKSEKCKV